ncbi:hypothetical protein KL905_004651 [Ogataea polymorpha]|uniref:Uncharacterized protein n=1 Tax=Ogataea polymorpha TaxID=460523 RepID=A0A9P8T398_9ASCO|nr:hypothetical protein KL935_000032 [Ogataea polymorpha]KAG7908603.1 hypothetical protein KL907_002093 [Ogataea polymorpha]KAG7908664.1 hypothetical protein KL906_002895 [Ogataea polymorpha]KAG7916248.1 hypothetical protein KL905_004651 [Ogataea polymorpha]KAG7920787.1 hypothetical protein KL927_000031 [Ogataea polymorpha]
MNSHLNNTGDNQELKHPPHFKNVFSSKDSSPVGAPEQDTDAMEVVESRRPSVVVPTNLDASMLNTPSTTAQPHNESNVTFTSQMPSTSEISSSSTENLLSPPSSIDIPHRSRSSSKTSKRLRRKRSKFYKGAASQRSTSPALLTNNLPISKRFRSRSLPNIWIPSHKQTKLLIDDLQQRQPSEKVPVPPVNLQSMHEIDLHEILKNPQLRHDILFEPQLQFRPNLDGERGKRKRMQGDRYWSAVKAEIRHLMSSENLIADNSIIVVMFQTLKDILLSLLPSKDKANVEEIMDISLLVQELNSKCFNFIKFSNWISAIFKMHCAPMRDSWVDEMNSIFEKACSTSPINVDQIVEGLHVLFSILEAMKLDVANHQIRILRPLLCSTAVAFEKEYFQTIIRKNKINLNGSLDWYRKSKQRCNGAESIQQVLSYGILNLLSCSHMCSEFPDTLTFDHSRLVILRADIRQLICIKICLILYQNLVTSHRLSTAEYCSADKLQQLKKEILSIIVDENGNSKWTRNLNNLAVHLVSKASQDTSPSKVKFCFNWLLNQTQPISQIYSMLEQKLLDNVWRSLNTGDKSGLEQEVIIREELNGVAERLNRIVEFHVSVFGDIYN